MKLILWRDLQSEINYCKSKIYAREIIFPGIDKFFFCDGRGKISAIHQQGLLIKYFYNGIYEICLLLLFKNTYSENMRVQNNNFVK